MTKGKRFEDLLCWQKARQLTNAVYGTTNQPAFAKDYGLRDQIRRAAASIMHNIAEGSGAGSDREFIRFLKFARQSADEVQSELYLALDQGYISTEEQHTVYDLANESKRLINGLINYLKASPQPHNPKPDAKSQPQTTRD